MLTTTILFLSFSVVRSWRTCYDVLHDTDSSYGTLTDSNLLLDNHGKLQLVKSFSLKVNFENIVAITGILTRKSQDSEAEYIAMHYSEDCENYNIFLLRDYKVLQISEYLGYSMILFPLPVFAKCLHLSYTLKPTQSFYLLGCSTSNTLIKTNEKIHKSSVPSIRKKRLMGGTHLQPGQWPFLVSLQFKFKGIIKEVEHIHLCAGSLIHPHWVLTSAHCFTNYVKADLENVNNWKVKLIQTEGSNVETAFNIRRVFRYPMYLAALAKGKFVHDIALVQLEPLMIGSKLPVATINTDTNIAPGTSCIVVGRGASKPGDRSYLFSDVVSQASIPIMDTDTCYHRYRNVPEAVINGSVLCTVTYKGKNGFVDTCNGDSGGPLMCPINGQMVLTGITFYGYQCGNPKYGGVYVNVAHYADWIKDTLSKHSNDV